MNATQLQNEIIETVREIENPKILKNLKCLITEYKQYYV